MPSDRLVDRIIKNEWTDLSTDVQKIVAKKIQKKIYGYVNELRQKGSLS